jgi:hypothetical protein
MRQQLGAPARFGAELTMDAGLLDALRPDSGKGGMDVL